MDQTLRYKVNSPDVAWEAFDGEVIIVNLQSGHYFSARGTGAMIWRTMAAGASRPEVDAQITSAFHGDAAEIQRSVGAFINMLLERSLLVPLGEGESSRVAPSADPPATAAKSEFSPPSLETHSDMQDILLLDPIHEVDDTGWPHRR